MSKKEHNEKDIKVLNVEELPFKHSCFDDNNPKPKILILGSRITDKSIAAGYYYLGLTKKENAFWPIMKHCFNDSDFVSDDVATIQKALVRHNVVVSDLIYKCKYYGSGDNETVEGSEETNIDDLLNLVGGADYVILNGGFKKKPKTAPLNYFHRFLKDYIDRKTIINEDHVLEQGLILVSGKRIPYLSLDSSSGENRKALELKKEVWKENIARLIGQ